MERRPELGGGGGRGQWGAGRCLGGDPAPPLLPVKQGEGPSTLPLASRQSWGDRENFPVCHVLGCVSIYAPVRAPVPARDPLGPS